MSSGIIVLPNFFILNVVWDCCNVHCNRMMYCSKIIISILGSMWNQTIRNSKSCINIIMPSDIDYRGSTDSFLFPPDMDSSSSSSTGDYSIDLIRTSTAEPNVPDGRFDKFARLITLYVQICLGTIGGVLVCIWLWNNRWNDCILTLSVSDMFLSWLTSVRLSCLIMCDNCFHSSRTRFFILSRLSIALYGRVAAYYLKIAWRPISIRW